MAKRLEANTILIIEDNVNCRIFAARVLELEGYHVIQTGTGEGGLRVLRETKVALVILDLRLPDIHGREILKQIRSEPGISTIPVIVFTASVPVGSHDQVFTSAASECLIKPVSAKNLKNAVARNLKLKR